MEERRREGVAVMLQWHIEGEEGGEGGDGEVERKSKSKLEERGWEDFEYRLVEVKAEGKVSERGGKCSKRLVEFVPKSEVSKGSWKGADWLIKFACPKREQDEFRWESVDWLNEVVAKYEMSDRRWKRVCWLVEVVAKCNVSEFEREVVDRQVE